MNVLKQTTTVVSLALLGTVLAILDPNAEAVAPPGASPVLASCGALRVVAIPAHEATFVPNHRIRVSAGSRVLQEIEDTTIEDLSCRSDIAGTSPTLLVVTAGSGSSAFGTLSVFASSPPRRLLTYRSAQGTLVDVQYSSHGMNKMLVLNDGTFDGARGVAHVNVPGQLPLAACYVGGRFIDCTRENTRLIDQRAALYLATLTTALHQDLTDQANGAALGLYLCLRLKGTSAASAEQAIATIARQSTTDDDYAISMARWLASFRPEVATWLANRGQLLTISSVP